jgi:hypothetical protein
MTAPLVPIFEDEEYEGPSFAWIPLLASGILVATLGFFSIHNDAYAVAAGSVGTASLALSVAVPVSATR